MRKLQIGIFYLATLLTTQITFAQTPKGCFEEYKAELNNSMIRFGGKNQSNFGSYVTGSTGALIAGLAGMSLMANSVHSNSNPGFAEAMTVPGGFLLGFGTHLGIVELTNIKEAKMIRLIRESEAFRQGQEPGKILNRLHRKISKRIQGVTLEETANYITKANKSGDLCRGNNLLSFREIKRGLKRGYFKIDMYDDEEGADDIVAKAANVNESDRSITKERSTSSDPSSKGITVGNN